MVLVISFTSTTLILGLFQNKIESQILNTLSKKLNVHKDLVTELCTLLNLNLTIVYLMMHRKLFQNKFILDWGF